MENADFFRQIKLDRTSLVPLKAQLEQALGTLFARLAPGSAIPPEREMAEKLQISRVTVRSALQKFFEEGVIERQRRIGTKIAARPHRRTLAFNPLSLGPGFAAPPKYTLRFLLFEDLPNLKDYWTKTINAFNRTRQNAKVELVFLPPDEDVRNIEQVVKNQAIDILMVADTMPTSVRNQLRLLPESILELYRSRDYLFSQVPPEAEKAFRYMLPVRFVFPQIYWNQDLVAKLKLPELPVQTTGDALREWMLSAAGRLSGNMSVSGHLWDYFCMANVPESYARPERLAQGLREIAELGQRAGQSRERLFNMTQNYQLEPVERFITAKQLILTTYPHMIHCFPPPAFKLGVLPFPKAATERLAAYSINLALTKNLIDVYAAEEFLHFLLSPEIQRLGGELCDDCPVRRSEAIAYLEQKQLTEAGHTEEFLKRLFFVAGNHELKTFQDVAVFFFREELQKVLTGVLSVPGAAEEFERKLSNYKNQMNL